MTVTTPPQPKCGAVRKGKTCTQVAGWGTDHVGWGSCKLHGGSTRAGRAAALRMAGEAMTDQERQALMDFARVAKLANDVGAGDRILRMAQR